MIISILIWFALIFGETAVGTAIRMAVDRLLGRPLNEVEREVNQAIEHASSVFHECYGRRYGSPHRTFIDREKNRKKLLRSTFPRVKHLTTIDLDPRGFDGGENAPKEAIATFIEAFYEALDQTNSRVLNRDLSLQDASRERSEIYDAIALIGAQVSGLDHKLDAILKEREFPDPLRAAIAQPDLNELSDLMRTRHAQQALDYAEQRIEAINTALAEYNDLGGRYASALRTHRQRLLFAAASAASWLGDIEAGRAYWRRAHNLGSIDPEWHEQAAATLFNIELKDDLRHLMTEMDRESDVYRRSVPLLAFLDEDWQTVDVQLVDAQSADLLLTRVHARLQIIDPQDTKAVRETAELIDQTDGDQDLAIINLSRARLTLDLLQLVIEGYTPLNFDRSLLIDSVLQRTSVALETTVPNTLLQAQALGYASIAAKHLRDDSLAKTCTESVEALEDSVRSSVFFLYDKELTPIKIDSLLSEGRINASQVAILKAAHFRTTRKLAEIESVLREGLFSTADERQRAHVLRELVQHLHWANRTDEAQRLIAITPLRPADRWLLRTEILPVGRHPIDLAEEVAAFPLDVGVIERLAHSSLAAVEFTSPEDPSPDAAILVRAEKAVYWTTRLVEVLPSSSSRFLRAQALYAARRYSDLLTESRNLDPVYAELATELEAWALVGLGCRAKAVRLLVAACAEFPDSEQFAVNASALLLADGHPDEVVALLKPRIAAGSTGPEILVHYAQALLALAPDSREQASEAFDLLTQAYDMSPDPRVSQRAWEAARGARRTQEAGRFFAEMMQGARHAKVQTAEDIYNVMHSTGHRFVQIDGGVDALTELMRLERERLDQLDTFLSSHTVAYVDLFRLTGRPWERWTLWTQQFEQLFYDGPAPPGRLSVLADWPSARLGLGRQDKNTELNLFADPTAILTLGVLGPETAQQILDALGMLCVHSGTFDELREEMARISHELLIDGAHPYVETAQYLRETPNSIVSYSEEVESAAPNDPALQASRVDLGVVFLYNALYVTDTNNSQDWLDEVNKRRISSAVLLAALNAAGEITASEAKSAAEQHPNAFEGWDRAVLRSIPETLVFDEYSLLDWIDTGLANVLSNRIKVGPWAWMRIADEVERREAMSLAHKRLQGLLEVLRTALDDGVVVEVESVAGDDHHVDPEVVPGVSVLAIEKLWSDALRSLRTAQAHGLQLWADDRFYSLLLRTEKPTAFGLEIEAILDPLLAWADEMPPTPTLELLDRLSRSGRLTPDLAQDSAAMLFANGYRMVHPILLANAIRQFPVPVSAPLTSPFKKLVDSIAEIPKFLPEIFGAFEENRAGFLRIACGDIGKRFIVAVWKTEGLGDDQRRTLADAFLNAMEKLFIEVSPEPSASRSDLTQIIFWQDLAFEFQMMSVQDKENMDLYFAALSWLGTAASCRERHRRDIIRLLEDNMLATVKIAKNAPEKEGEDFNLPQTIKALVTPALVPFVESGLMNGLDPLLRRTIGTLAQIANDGRVTARYYYNTGADEDAKLLMVPEEETEQVAADILTRTIADDPTCAPLIHATEVVFSYRRPIPVEWRDAGVPTDEIRVDVRCSLFTLLWADLPDMRELIIRLIVFHLAAIDPVLAHRVLTAEADLLSDDVKRAREARENLAIDVLQSGYFDLRRDLTHAVHRFRQYDFDVFSRFLGWIGEEDARILAEHPVSAHIIQIGSAVVPKGHFLGFTLLTDSLDNGNLILEAARQMNSVEEESEHEESNLPEWLVALATNVIWADDPFVAACALRDMLLVLSTMDQDPELEINGQKVKASNWVAGYLDTSLNVDVGQTSQLKQRMLARRRIASATMLLAAFACRGDKQFEVYNKREDPLEMWLGHVWILASKLQVALVGLYGGLMRAAESATTAVLDLGLANPNARVLDAFDPYAFGFEGDDIGKALTLTAMLKAVRQSSSEGQHPPWWTDKVRVIVEGLANARSEEAPTSDERLDNRFGFVSPLRVHILAQKLIEALAT